MKFQSCQKCFHAEDSKKMKSLYCTTYYLYTTPSFSCIILYTTYNITHMLSCILFQILLIYIIYFARVLQYLLPIYHHICYLYTTMYIALLIFVPSTIYVLIHVLSTYGLYMCICIYINLYKYLYS